MKDSIYQNLTTWNILIFFPKQITLNIIQQLTYVEVDMECYSTVNVTLTDAERRSI